MKTSKKQPLNTLPTGTLVRLHRGMPAMEIFRTNPRWVWLGLPGRQPHLVHYRPAQRVEVVE